MLTEQSEKPKKWQEEEALRRYRIIAPLLDETLDPAALRQLRDSQAEKHRISERSIRRYLAAYSRDGYNGLVPMNREKRRKQKMPENFDSLVQEAIRLKREVPGRSVQQIIMILEMEGRVGYGVLKRSTLQRHLYNAGFGKKQMKKYLEGQKSSSKRFCRAHRMELVESDIKYGIRIPAGKDGKMVQTYLVVIIDNHSRYVLSSGFYDNQCEEIVEDAYHKAFLRFGKILNAYHDNGKQFVSKQLLNSLARLGTRVIRAKPYSPSSKGGVEVFNRFVNSFLDEAKAQKIKTLEELNRYWNIWLEEYYHQKPHEGIAEYYRSQSLPVPAGGISPQQEWNRDSRPLEFLDAGVIREAFLHHEMRRVDNAGCISFCGKKYETSTSLIGAEVEISYDPMEKGKITITYPGVEPFAAEPIKIGEFCSRKEPVPACLLPEEPEASRFLEGLEAKHKQTRQMQADAISFASYGKEGGGHV